MKRLILTGIAVLWPAASWAADFTPLGAKLGLWESTVSTEMPGMRTMPQIPEETLAKMPPQQRAQMEAMMKNRAGTQQIKNKFCMTPESLKSGTFSQQPKYCTTKVVSSSSSKQVVHIECNQEQSKSTGDLTVELIDAQHMKGTMVMKSTAGGQTHDMKMSFDNKWLASDCGDVKPAVPK